MSKREKLTRKQSVFIKEYLIDLNATQAAIRAGYSKNAANTIGNENLLKPSIKNVIDSQLAERAKKNELTIERCLAEYKRLALFDIRKLYDEEGNVKPIHTLDDDTAAALASIESEELYAGRGAEREMVGHIKKVKSYDKRAALADVMRHFGGFKADNEQQKQNAPVMVDLKDLPADEKMKILQKLF
jgi:phage terminase small subunit